MQLRVSAAAIVLVQYKAAESFVDFNWTPLGRNNDTVINYTIEAAIAGTQFADAVELLSTGNVSARFTLQEFNQHMRKLMLTGSKQTIQFRIRANKAPTFPLYSDAAAVEITTYQPYIDFVESRILRLPGNCGNWSVPSAPKIVSPSGDGEYEGYVNFTHPDPQFWLVKGTQWDNATTYNATGTNKFGFNGDFFTVTAGAGVYQVNVSTNTNTWSCTKINCWGLNGTAVSLDQAAEIVMSFDPGSLSWCITTDLAKGDFLFRANKTNGIVFGHNPNSETGIPDYNGEKIKVPKAGNYTILLSLQSAGNYVYSMQKNS